MGLPACYEHPTGPYGTCLVGGQAVQGPLWPTKTEPPEAPADRLGRTVPHSRAALLTVSEDWEGSGIIPNMMVVATGPS